MVLSRPSFLALHTEMRPYLRVAPTLEISRLLNRLKRELALRLETRICPIKLQSPLISFTFDDFPQSALTVGGAILANYGLRGTYYASLGLMGTDTPAGRIFTVEDLYNVVSRGHELGCHTFDHCHSWDTPPSRFVASIRRNRAHVARLLPNITLSSFAYPISCPRPATKRRTAAHYRCSRGGGQTFNSETADLNYLKAFFIEQSVNDFDAIARVISAAARTNGWLIFATHDICDSPTRFGCTPQFFELVVRCAVASGATILPVSHALRRLAPP